MSNFEKFTQRKFKSFAIPMATITKDSVINFNVMAMEKYVKEFIYAVFYYDRKDRLVGIKFSHKDAPEAYKIRKDREGRLASISAMSFLRYYNIKPTQTLSYQIKWNEQDEMLIIDLKQHEKKPGVKTSIDDGVEPF